MSETKTKLLEDIKTAMKAREQTKLTILRGLSAAIKQVEVDTRKDVDEPTVLSIFQKEIKKRRDSLQFAKDANRTDLVEQNEMEIALIQSYLGEQFGEDKLKEIISGLIGSGVNSLGQIMGELNKHHKGKFDGKAASELAKSMLG